MDELIERLKTYQERTQKPLEELAFKIGVTKQAVWDWFANRYAPNKRVIREAIERFLTKEKADKII